jgi:hypothetical protein
MFPAGEGGHPSPEFFVALVWYEIMKNIVIITTAIFLAGLPLPLVAQMPLESAHQPAISAPVPGTQAGDAAASDGVGALAKLPLTQVARVNGVALTEAELNEEMQRLFPYYAIHGGRVPPSAEPEIRQKAMRDLVLHELVYQEARRRRLQVPPLTWQKRLNKIQKGYPSRQAYEAAATQQYGSVAAYERSLRRAMLVEQLWAAEVTQKSAVTEQAVRAYYQSHKAQYVRPEAVRLQTITISVPNTATAEQKQEARKIAEQALVKAQAAKNYEEFGTLAEQLSQDDWRVMMGDHGWVHRGTVTPDIEPALFSLKPGETSGVVEFAGGFIILRANGYQPKRQMRFSEMAASIRKRLETEQRQKRGKEFEELLRSKAQVQIL